LVIVTKPKSKDRKSVIIEVSSVGMAQNRKLKGTVEEFGGKSLTLLCDEEIPSFSAVKVQSWDRLFLGKVVKSVPDHRASWAVYIDLRRTLMVV
jgi:hypothetical protein